MANASSPTPAPDQTATPEQAASASEAAASSAPQEDTKPTPSPKPARRNRKNTEQAIITAVGTVLARDGFANLGVNAIARESGVDKVLIYRYFGGLPELLGAFAQRVEFFPSADELLGQQTSPDIPIHERVAGFLMNLAHALHDRPATLEILAWELVERNDLTATLEAARWTVYGEYFERALTDEQQAAHPNLIPTVSFLAQGVMMVLMRTRAQAAGTPAAAMLQEKPDVALAGIDAMVRQLCQTLYPNA